jgi:hypothetical protein
MPVEEIATVVHVVKIKGTDTLSFKEFPEVLVTKGELFKHASNGISPKKAMILRARQLERDLGIKISEVIMPDEGVTYSAEVEMFLDLESSTLSPSSVCNTHLRFLNLKGALRIIVDGKEKRTKIKIKEIIYESIES